MREKWSQLFTLFYPFGDPFRIHVNGFTIKEHRKDTCKSLTSHHNESLANNGAKWKKWLISFLSYDGMLGGTHGCQVHLLLRLTLQLLIGKEMLKCVESTLLTPFIQISLCQLHFIPISLNSYIPMNQGSTTSY